MGCFMDKPLKDRYPEEDEQLWIGWKWFEYHSKQRLEIFKFFVTIYGALIGFSAGSLRPGFSFISLVLSLFSTLLCLAFWQLDVRSRQLIEIGENIMSRRWSDVGHAEDLNPVQKAGVLLSTGLRYKHGLLVVYVLSLVFSLLMFALSVYSIHYPISLLTSK